MLVNLGIDRNKAILMCVFVSFLRTTEELNITGAVLKDAPSSHVVPEQKFSQILKNGSKSQVVSYLVPSSSSSSHFILNLLLSLNLSIEHYLTSSRLQELYSETIFQSVTFKAVNTSMKINDTGVRGIFFRN